MPTFSKHILSGSVNGKPIQITTASNTVHAAGSATTTLDEVWLWASNTATAAKELQLYLGTGSATDNRTFHRIPPKDGHFLICEGLPVNNSVAVYALATATGDLKIVGYVNRIAT